MCSPFWTILIKINLQMQMISPYILSWKTAIGIFCFYLLTKHGKVQIIIFHPQTRNKLSPPLQPDSHRFTASVRRRHPPHAHSRYSIPTQKERTWNVNIYISLRTEYIFSSASQGLSSWLSTLSRTLRCEVSRSDVTYEYLIWIKYTAKILFPRPMRFCQ